MNLCIRIILIYKTLPEYERMNAKIEQLEANQKQHNIRQFTDEVRSEDSRDFIKDEYSETIQKVDKKLQLKYVQKWIEDNKRFTPTKASINAQKWIETKNCILLVGPFGQGKSSILRHLALELLKKGYEILPNIVIPLSIQSYFDMKKKQVFVIDDFCGREKIDRPCVDIWAQEEIIEFLKTIMEPSRQGTTKLLMACSNETNDHSLFKSLEFYEHFKFVLPELTDEERILMMQKYIHIEGKGNITDFQYNGIRFPLLCKLALGRPKEQLERFFSNPNELIIQDFKNMKQRRNTEFCVITLLTLCHNRFEQEWLNPNFTNHTFQERITGICSEFNLDLQVVATRTKIEKTFNSLEQTYISKTSGVYNFIHNKICDIAAIVCGQEFFKSFVENADIVFISDKYKLDCEVKENEENAYIIICEENVNVYFQRLLRDLKNGETYSFLHNKQLRSDVYRKLLLDFWSKNSSEITNLLNKIKENLTSLELKNDISEYTNESFDRNIFYKDLQKKNVSITYIKSPLIESVIEGYLDIVQLLLKFKCDVNETYKFGMTALHVACVLGNISIVKVLLDNRADINVCDKMNRSPLYIACDEGHAAIAELLLESKSDVALCDKKGRTPLHAAAANFHQSTAKCLLDYKSDPNVCDKSGRTPLFLSAESGDTQLIQLLLKNGSKISFKDNDGCTPLFKACSHNQLSVVVLLIQNKGVVLDTDNGKRSPLFIASSYGFSQIVGILIDHGADINICDKNGKSALHVACEGGHDDTVDLILQKFPKSIEIKDINALYPLHVACMHGRKHIVSSLISNGASVNSADILGRTPLYLSCEKGRKEIVEILLKKNDIEINMPDKDGVSPLIVTCRLGHSDITEVMLNHHADVFHCNKWGRSSLNLACRKGHLESVKLLLNARAEINEQDFNKGSPLYTACEEGHTKIVQYLLDKNADSSLCDKHGKSCLHAAVLGGHEDIVKELISRSSVLILCSDEFGKTALDYAVEKGYDSIAERLKIELMD